MAPKARPSKAVPLPRVGDKLLVPGAKGGPLLVATCRFAGTTQFAPGDWVGVELSVAQGKNDGSVQGERYFDCPALHGLFLKPGAVRPYKAPATKGRRPSTGRGFDEVRQGSDALGEIEVDEVSGTRFEYLEILYERLCGRGPRIGLPAFFHFVRFVDDQVDEATIPEMFGQVIAAMTLGDDGDRQDAITEGMDFFVFSTLCGPRGLKVDDQTLAKASDRRSDQWQDPKNMPRSLRTYLLQSWSHLLLPEDVHLDDALVLSFSDTVDTYLVVWLEGAPRAANCPVYFHVASTGTGKRSPRQQVNAMVRHTLKSSGKGKFGAEQPGVLDVWGDTDKATISIAPEDVQQVNAFIEQVQKQTLVETHVAVAAAALTVRLTGPLPDAPTNKRILQLCQEALHACSCPASVHAVCAPCVPESGTVLKMLVTIHSAGDLHIVCDKVLHDSCDWALQTKLRRELAVDKTDFAMAYQRVLLQMETLTPHQEAKLGEVAKRAETSHVHLRAPAGGGKTFVGLRFLVDALDKSTAENTMHMYVASNEALCLTVAGWLALREPTRFEGFLQRLVFFCPTFGDKPHRADLGRNGWAVTPVAAPGRVGFIVVDEAHHVLHDTDTWRIVEGWANGSRLLLLSDKSQWKVSDKPVLKSMADVCLEEVVRSTRLLVSASTIFQNVPPAEKSRSQHGAGGPPLRTHVFGAQTDANRMHKYATEVLGALHDLQMTFGMLDFTNKLLLVGPDSEFVKTLLRHLRPLANNWDFVCARDASRSFCLLDTCPSNMQHHKHTIVADAVDKVDGLERLIVIVVGLDGDASSGEDQYEAVRSRIYRGITRAQMMASVVQEHVPGGLLEFLCNVKLSDSHRIIMKLDEDSRATFDDIYLKKRSLIAMADSDKERVAERAKRTGRPVQDDVVVKANEAARNSAALLENESQVVSLVVRVANNGTLDVNTLLADPNVRRLAAQYGQRKPDVCAVDPERLRLKAEVELIPKEQGGATLQGAARERKLAGGRLAAPAKVAQHTFEQNIFDTARNDPSIVAPSDCNFMPFDPPGPEYLLPLKEKKWLEELIGRLAAAGGEVCSESLHNEIKEDCKWLWRLPTLPKDLKAKLLSAADLTDFQNMFEEEFFACFLVDWEEFAGQDVHEELPSEQPDLLRKHLQDRLRSVTEKYNCENLQLMSFFQRLECNDKRMFRFVELFDKFVNKMKSNGQPMGVARVEERVDDEETWAKQFLKAAYEFVDQEFLNAAVESDEANDKLFEILLDDLKKEFIL